MTSDARTDPVRLIGKVYGIPPQPPVEANQQLFDAGALRFGVEYRSLDPESLAATYQDDPEHLRELLERSPEGGFTDAGVTVHVFDADDGVEYLRFDVFDDEPHYHYIHRTDDGTVVNQVIDFDVTAHGDMLDWALEALRTRIAPMLRAAGGAALAERVDPDVVERALHAVEAASRSAGSAPTTC
jgi:hypothetical protein